MAELIESYFVHYNLIFPLLHRPTLEEGLKTGLHLTDEGFGSVVLLVCAIGARFSSDPAVLPAGTKHWQWAGWQWFERVNEVRKLACVSSPRLYDLQVDVVSADSYMKIVYVLTMVAYGGVRWVMSDTAGRILAGRTRVAIRTGYGSL